MGGGRERRLAGNQIDHDLTVRSSTMMRCKLSTQAIADVLDVWNGSNARA